MKLCKMRRGLLRLLVAGSLTACLLIYLNFYLPSSQKSISKHDSVKKHFINHLPPSKKKQTKPSTDIDLLIPGKGQGTPSSHCAQIKAPETDIYTVDQYQKFDFQVSFEFYFMVVYTSPRGESFCSDEA